MPSSSHFFSTQHYNVTMEHIASTLGLGFLDTSARKAVMKRSRPGTSPQESSASFNNSHRASLLCLKQSVSLDDDDTMSTLSSSSSDSSLSSRGSSVTFSYPLVTEIYARPRTTPEEKSQLFYKDSEYRQFRHEYIYGRRQRKRVDFSMNPPGVWAYEAQGEKSSLYYNQADLQR